MAGPLQSDELRGVLLGIIEVQPLNTVFRRLAQAALGVAGADYAAIGVYNDERGLDYFEAYGLSEAERDLLPHPPRGLGLLGEFAIRHGTINVDQVTEHAAFVGFPDGHPEMGPFLGVPVLSGGRSLGAFYVTRRPGSPSFLDQERAALEELALYAAIAITNARTMDAQSRRAEAAEILAEAAASLELSRGNDDAVVRLASALRRLFPTALQVGVAACDGTLDADCHASGDGESGGLADRLGRELREAPHRHVRTRPKLGPHTYSDWVDGAVVSADLSGLTDGGQIFLGVAAERPLEVDERHLLRSLGDLGVITLTVLGQRRAQASLDRYAERDRIARDLHDEIIQAVYAAGLNLQAARSEDEVTKDQALARAGEELRAVISDLRSYIKHLTSDAEAPLPGAILQTRIEELLGARSGPPRWSLDIDLGDAPLTQAMERELFLMARELISNVERHAEADNARLILRVVGGHANLVVSDNGAGFRRAEVQAESVGLRGLEQRVADLGGSVLIESAPGEGTSVTARVPVTAEA